MRRHVLQPVLMTLVIFQCLLSGVVSTAAGQSVTLLEEDASFCAIVQALSSDISARCQQPRMRSIILRPTPPAGPQLTTLASPPPVPPKQPLAATPSGPRPRVYAFATRIQFAWNSAQLAPEASRLLDTLADALNDAALAEKVVQIEGHTDSAGSSVYNHRLSFQRALSVQRYLHTVHGIPLSRIPAVGKGESELYDPEQPRSSSNRRVQFVNLTESVAAK